MPKDLRVVFPNRPGTFQKACDVLARAGINVEGFGSDIRPGEQWGYVHFLVEDAERAIELLDKEGLEVVDVHDVDVIQIENRPGAMADVVRTYSNEGENLEILYTASNDRVVIGTESMRQPIKGVRTSEARYRHKPGN